MATVTSKTAAAIQEIEDAGIATAGINSSGHMTLTRNDNSVIDAGSVASPSGSVIMFAGGVVPPGWLLCNGQAVSRTTYAALFAAIGTVYGAGDGTTFNLPNLEARFPRMIAASLGATGGVGSGHTHPIATHTHSTPAHNHVLEGGSTPAHARFTIVNVAAPNIFQERLDSVASWTATHRGDATSVGTTSDSETTASKVIGTTPNGGSATSGSGGATVTDSAGSLPPYINLNFIIKT
jgi:microcystin-dependent protein